MLLSAGERISMALLSIAIRDLGGDAISFTGSQSGIITNDRHSDARIIEVRPFRVQDELARGKIVVVAGYQGVSYKKGSHDARPGRQRDTTAVAIAAALGARVVRDLQRRGRGLLRRSTRIVPGSPTHWGTELRGNAGNGRVGRTGAQRASGGIRQGEEYCHLCPRDRTNAADPRRP